jgi:diaminohydroxyphosphoribosylaminopyrimidine deaminase/5-amino-6-(5-phosphoribosylamino)uracil reductase
MARAISLSRRHLGLTGTNPSVGCVIVKNGKVVGEAVTAPGGRPHAETQALEAAGEAARGATAYVTLEPCSHYGKTPPCANALAAAGVARVVVSVTDPDPRVSGRGLGILREAGIQVETGLLEEEGRRALAGYLMRQTNGRPYVTLKLAVSADGMLGRRGEEVAITGPEVREEVHRLRAESDAILVGIGTVLADDPELTVRIPGLEGRSPDRIVLDRRLELPVTSKLVQTAGQVPVVAVFSPPSGLAAISPSRGEIDAAPAQPTSCRCGDDDHSDSVASATSGMGQEAYAQPISLLEGEMPGRAEGGEFDSRRSKLTDAGVEILETLDLHSLLTTLAERGMSSLLIEGGAVTAQAFLDAGLVDRILLFQSPEVIGEGGLESPVTPSDMPAGFKPVGESAFGSDRSFDYERVS